MVVTTEDLAVPPAKQRAMAEAIPAPVFEVEGDHTVPAIDPPLFTAAVLDALRSVTTHRRGSAAGAASLR